MSSSSTEKDRLALRGHGQFIYWELREAEGSYDRVKKNV